MSTGCGLNGQSFGSLHFWGGRLTFLASYGSAGPSQTRIYRTALHSSILTYASGLHYAVAFAPTGARSGVAMVDDAWDGPTSMVGVAKLSFLAP